MLPIQLREWFFDKWLEENSKNKEAQ